MSIFRFLGKLPARPAKKFSLPWVRSEREEENVRHAGTCEARCRVFFRSRSLTHRTHPDKSSSQPSQPALDSWFATSLLQPSPYATIFSVLPSSHIPPTAYNR